MGSDRGADPGVHGLQASLLVELQAAVTALRWTDAGTAMDAFLTAHEAVHDGYRNVIARILSSILHTFGQDAVEQLHEAHSTWSGLSPLMAMPPKDLVQRIADVNHWHMSRFRLIEDDEKITFLLQPCGSGGRLINEGRYYVTDERSYALMPRASRSTFGMADFPVYCNHCSEMSRTILKGGGHGWLIEGWTPDHRFGGCRLHVFKSFAHVNGEFFRRLELTPPSEAPGETGERWFSPDELTGLSTPMSARLRRALDRHDAAQASALIAATKAAWEAGLLPAYRSWVTELYGSVLRAYGPEAFAHLFRDTVFDLFSKAHEMAVRGVSKHMWRDFWACLGGLQGVITTPAGTSLTISASCLFAPDPRADPLRLATRELCHSFNGKLGGQGPGSASMLPTESGDLLMHVATS